MKLAALYSGGKDSSFSIYLAELMGHSVTDLLTVVPENSESLLFHTPNLAFVQDIAEAMGKKHYSAVAQEGKEMDALQYLMEEAVKRGIEGIVTGAVLSDFQFFRIEKLCFELGIKCISPLWRVEQSLLMQELIASGIRAVVISVSAEGLSSEHLGREIDRQFLKELKALHEMYGINISGEGGEYESFVIDSPMHRKILSIADYEIIEKGKMKTMKIKRLEKRSKGF